MDKRQLEKKLWDLCDTQDTITDRNVHMSRDLPMQRMCAFRNEAARAQSQREKIINEILDEFLRIHTVVNWPAEEALAEKRAWAAAWKKAAKKGRAQAEGWSQLFRQRHEQRDEARAECTRLADQLDGSPWAGVLEQRDEARAECTRLFEERAQQVTWQAGAELENVMERLEVERDFQAEAADWQMKRAIKAEEERDEARAECTRLADQLDGSPWYWYDLLTERGQVELMAERDEALAECTDLAEQRSIWADEAAKQRHESHHWRRLYHQAVDNMEGWREWGAQATEERDEALAECTRLADLVDWVDESRAWWVDRAFEQMGLRRKAERRAEKWKRRAKRWATD